MDEAKSIKTVLTGRWLHSHEEDSGDEMVFRPGSYDFPPSRGRMGYEFHADRRCSLIGIAPADGSIITGGCRWRHKEGDPRTILIEDDSGVIDTLTVDIDGKDGPLIRRKR
ncbi:MAG TPA: hypothetical protein ENJ80_09565 [Gammaproteobacteria bacterium]|nr:hypothetical protein [Gammaproteobacteria bacterium]